MGKKTNGNKPNFKSRLLRLGLWSLFATALIVLVFVVWYVQSFKRVFIERDIAEAGKIRFKSIRLDFEHGLVIKYQVDDLRDVENTGYLVPWRGGYRSLSDEYFHKKATEPPPPRSKYDPNRSINSAQLLGSFSLSRAPNIGNLPETDLKRIQDVIDEMRRGYGGTLVVSPDDDVLDSPAFVAHYLREFSIPDSIDDAGMATYNYRFARLLARVWRFDSSLKDIRLDWDVFRSFLLYEDFQSEFGNVDSYRSGHGTVETLESAKDLLWLHIAKNGPAIVNDQERLNWWIDCVTEGIKDGKGRPRRRWVLLQLVTFADRQLPDQPESSNNQQHLFGEKRKPDPHNVFIPLTELTPHDAVNVLPPFEVAIQRLAESQNLRYEVWDLRPQEMPATTAYELELSTGMSIGEREPVLGQESWSSEPTWAYFHWPIVAGGTFATPPGWLPNVENDDGVFFFTFKGVLYVWPKGRMDDAVIQLMFRAGLVDKQTLTAFREAGFAPLDVTVEAAALQD